MVWFALPLALLSLPLAFLDRRLAAACFAAALALAIASAMRKRRPRLSWAVAAIAVIGGVALAWNLYEIDAPRSTDTIDDAPYTRAAEGTRTVTLPLIFQKEDVTKLALLELKEGEDDIYEGFEPQLVEYDDAKGWRIIAYRVDGKVDVYDDVALPPAPDTSFAVTGDGMNEYRSTTMPRKTYEIDDAGRVTIDFAFTDIAGREIELELRETTTRSSHPTTILAPIGLSSTHPEAFPLFIINDIEFVRLDGSTLEARIDGEAKEFSGFPVPLPMQGQLRSFAKHSPDAEIMSLFPDTYSTLEAHETLPGTDVVERDGVRYLFDGGSLERIRRDDHEVVFSPALDLTRDITGRWSVRSFPDRGKIEGGYAVKLQGGKATMTLDIDAVQVPHQRDPLYRAIVNEHTFFGTWPKDYHFAATFDLAAGTVEAHWTNDGPSKEV